jgi:predicted DNA-binding ribbon-helix-helix protein
LHDHIIDGCLIWAISRPDRFDAKLRDRARTELLKRTPLTFFRRLEMSSTVVKRSIVLAGHKTSVSLEDAFWKSLKEIAISRGTTLSCLVTSIDIERQQGNLSSCLRLFVLNYYRCRLIETTRAREAPPDAAGMRQAQSA